MKADLIGQTCVLLLREGFTLKSVTQGCFDIISRKEDRILLLKILEDANAITQETSIEMLKIANYVHGSPIIIAEKAGAPLEPNVVYFRFGLCCVHPTTFREALHNRLPFVMSDHTGLAAILRGASIREIRDKEGYSQSYLSRKIGVSTRMIQQYENEKSKVTLAKAQKMFELFGDKVFEKLNIFTSHTAENSIPKTQIGKKFEQMGFQATETKKVPFDVMAKINKELILTEVGDKANNQLQPISHMLEANNLVIYNKKKPKKIPSLTRKEFLEFDKAYELLKFVKEQ